MTQPPRKATRKIPPHKTRKIPLSLEEAAARGYRRTKDPDWENMSDTAKSRWIRLDNGDELGDGRVRYIRRGGTSPGSPGGHIVCDEDPETGGPSNCHVERD